MLKIALSSLFLIGAAAAFFYALYHAINIFAGARKDTKRYLPLLGPFALFIPGLWDAEGNRSVTRLCLGVVAFALCFGALSLIRNLFPA